MKKIVLATGNQGKVREMADLLSDFGFDVVAQSEFNVPEAAETGTTFIENAIIKHAMPRKLPAYQRLPMIPVWKWTT